MRKVILLILTVFFSVSITTAQEQKIENYYNIVKKNVKEIGQIDKDGFPVGDWKFYEEDGTLKHIINFSTNFSKDYYPSGELKETRSFNPLTGARIGKVTTFYKNGTVKSVGLYNNDGEKNGIYKTYSEEGVLKSQELYKEGVKQG